MWEPRPHGPNVGHRRLLPLAPPLEHDDDVFSVAIHPLGHVAFTGRFWRLPAPLPDGT